VARRRVARHGEHTGACKPIRRFLSADIQIRHEPGVADGVDAFECDLAVLTRDRTIDEIKLLLGQGDFVFIAALGNHQGAPCAYIDLYRVEDSKLVEHWGFPEQIPPPDMRKNANKML
jgi:predicted SnoaL-like aldol condensation-catalyzing enzyme